MDSSYNVSRVALSSKVFLFLIRRSISRLGLCFFFLKAVVFSEPLLIQQSLANFEQRNDFSDHSTLPSSGSFADLSKSTSSHLRLSFVGSAPDPASDFVKRALGAVYSLGVPTSLDDSEYASDIYWTLDSMGLKNVDAYAVLENGSTSAELVQDSLSLIAENSEKFGTRLGLVFLTLGPISKAVCEQMANQSGHVFVLSSGFNSKNLDRLRDSACNAPHIVTVSALNAERNGIYEASNFGEQVNFAAPAFFNNLPNPRNVNPYTRKAVCAFAHVKTLAEELEARSQLNVDTLLKRLDESLVSLPSLNGKTYGGRALLECSDDR